MSDKKKLKVVGKAEPEIPPDQIITCKRSEIDELMERLQDYELVCATMRKALEKCRKLAYVPGAEDSIAEEVKLAIACNAGNVVAERMKKLEFVAQAAWAISDFVYLSSENEPDHTKSKGGIILDFAGSEQMKEKRKALRDQAITMLRATLVNLEGLKIPKGGKGNATDHH